MVAILPFEADLGELRNSVRRRTLSDESQAVQWLVSEASAIGSQLAQASALASRWIATARSVGHERSLLERALEQTPLTTASGRALMSLAESLMRTPDATRSRQLVTEQLHALDRDASRSGNDRFWFDRFAFAVLGGMGRLLPDVAEQLEERPGLKSAISPAVAALAGYSLRRAMRMMAGIFIAGETIQDALAKNRAGPGPALCSYDMLGEGARTERDADANLASYAQAIASLRSQSQTCCFERSGISVKLSAIEPRYSLPQRVRVAERLIPKVRELARTSAEANIGFTIDAEEADRLDLSLDVIAALSEDPATRDWPGLGLAVQAYGRRASVVIDWIAALARSHGRRMTLRLVKGAYWDTEIKHAQERGLGTFPVFTRKPFTDLSYLVCARRLFAAADVIHPQFATHNALTVASVLALAPPGSAYEFQRLHGMGDVLYRVASEDVPAFPPVRIYAPVGTHEALLPYLVRRLLENGANSSFVNQFLNPRTSIDDLVVDPIQSVKESSMRRDAIREPKALYADYPNSPGCNFGDPLALEALRAGLSARRAHRLLGGPIIDGGVPLEAGGGTIAIRSPQNAHDVVGFTRDASPEEIVRALDSASRAQMSWNAVPAADRARCLDRAAELLEARGDDFVSLLVREAGKTLPDAIAELREAIDFCRYYAARGRELFGKVQQMPGPSGEKNLLSLHGRGVFVCISPWNFPLAIFTGQITAALMAGNSAVAKPALNTPLIAHAMVRLLHDAGIPDEVLHLTPFSGGPKFSEVALGHPGIGGVVLTGSTATATAVNRTLASRDGPLVSLIAETGGLNAMVVDSTALPEQVVDDAIASAFTSAGQRCSALRVLYLQDEIFDRVVELLIGAMKLLRIGDPADPATDVGPVISNAALAGLQRHADRMRADAKLLHACGVPESAPPGFFFPPHLFELRALDQLKSEEFGPILHVARYRSNELHKVLEAIRGSGYGLTLGIQSRIESVANHVFRNVRVGNTYVNRNMIGAVVGVQPFGGCGLSGTGPKAGGPHYLLRFATERTLTVNTAAIGGSLELLAPT